MAVRTGRPPTCDCGACGKCKHREYMRGWYQRKTMDERRAIVAARSPEAVATAESDRYQRRKGTPLVIANYTLNNAIRRGRIERGPCEVCGTTENVHGHHDDYSKPLDVRWLCRDHHLELHRVLREVS